MVILIYLLILLLFSACADKKQELRILIEESSILVSERDMITSAVEAFREEHKNVTIVIESLPDAEDGRKEVLKHLQTEIMAGKGPDIFVLPCNTVYTDPLFHDVAQAMRNGMFEDLSQYYDEDAETDGLIPAVMDIGVVDGKRYVLPLWYDLPVACVNRAALAQTGYDEEIFSDGYMGLMRAVTEAENAELAADAAEFLLRENILNVLPRLIDQDTRQVNLSVEELSAFMEQYQAMRNIQESRDTFWVYQIPMTLGWYVEYTEEGLSGWAVKNRTFEICNLDTALANAAIAKLQGIEMDVIPLTGADGTLTADVTLWGAVGARCENTELAYKFLKKLLSEEYQWEAYRLGTVEQVVTQNKGWPVRTRDGISSLYQNLTLDIFQRISDRTQKATAAELRNIAITNADFPDLHTRIDQAQFSIPEEGTLGAMIENLNDPISCKALDVDINAIAVGFIEQLKWHLGEG